MLGLNTIETANIIYFRVIKSGSTSRLKHPGLSDWNR